MNPIIYPNGTQEWYQKDKLHREDGPAIIGPDGTQEWYQNGELHREDGPAIIRPDGTQSWWQDGNRHRNDGPAFIYPDGTQEWYLHGENASRKALETIKRLGIRPDHTKWSETDRVAFVLGFV